MPTTASTGRRPIIFALFLLSGCAGLIYEVVWTRELVFVFGGTTYAITTILVGFMSGLGLGSYVAGRFSQRLRQPGRIYGGLEIAVGLYALLVPILFHAAEPIYRAAYPHLMQAPWLLTAARFCIGFLVLLLPTTCMGATLPILVRYVTDLGQGFGRSVGLLYGINTFGAVLGTMAAGFWLIPAFGLTHTTRVAAALNLLVGSAAIVLLRLPVAAATPKRSPAVAHKPTEAAAPPPMSASTRRAVLIAFALSGFSAMVYQIAWTRALIMSLGSSTYAFTCILTAFILGLAVGSLAAARWVDRWKDPVLIFGALEIVIGMAVVVIAPMYGRAPRIVYAIVTTYRGQYDALLAVEFLLVIAVTFVPTLLMGTIFPLVTRMIATGMNDAGAATGRAYAVNTLGTIAGSFLAGFVMIRSEVLGVQGAIIAAAALNAVVGAALVLLSRPPTAGAWARRAVGATASVLLVPTVAIAAGQWDLGMMLTAPFYGRTDPLTVSQARRVIYYGEGVDLTVAVAQTIGFEDAITLSVNGKADASTDMADMVTQLLLGHIPASLVEDGRDAGVIGLGSGMTLGAIACYPSYEHLDCVEISDDVIKAAACFAPYNRQILTADPRVRMIRADGRNHLLLTDRKYDLIVSEPSNPWMSGVANLFTREFFSICRDRLRNRGRLCVWLHSYMMSVADFQMVIHTLSAVFKDVSIWQLSGTDYLLVASREPQRIALDGVLRRFATPAVREDLFRIGIANAGQVLGRFITSGRSLRDWVAAAPVHTDDNARLEFSAPRRMYSGESEAIAESLSRHQCAPFDVLLAPSTDGDVQESVRRTAVACSEARRLLAEANEERRKNDPVAAFARLVTARQRDPRNVEIAHRLVQWSDELRRRFPDAAQEGPVRRLLEQAAEVRPIVMAGARGTPASEIVKMLKQRAVQASGQGRWGWAAEYLSDACGFAPDDGGLIRETCLSFARAGRTNEAARQLDRWLARRPADGEALVMRARLAAQANDAETAVARLVAALRLGTATPASLMSDEMLRPGREDPRFKAILKHATSTRPASRPA
jgi:spermidine synthase